MPALLLSIFGVGKSLISGLIGWLSKRSLAEIGCTVLAMVCVVSIHRANHWKLVATERQAQVVKLQHKLDDEAAKAKTFEANGKRIAEQLRKQTDEENRRIAGDAQSLRVSGPGKSLCRPAAPASGGRKQAAPDANAPGPALPTDDLAGVPWDWLTGRAEEHDQLLAEVEAWRSWHDQVLRAWPKK